MSKTARLIPPLVLTLACACTTWQGKVVENGFPVADVACARTFLVGEPTHLGMPLLPMTPEAIDRVTKRIHRAIPEMTPVSAPNAADLIISVITVAKHVTTHAPPEPKVEWSAILERGGVSHRTEYQPTGPFLALEGEVLFGKDALVGFIRQLCGLVRQSRCDRQK